MNKNGFAPILILVFVALGMILAGEGYVILKNRVSRIPTQNTSVQQPTQPLIPPPPSPVTPTSTASASNTITKNTTAITSRPTPTTINAEIKAFSDTEREVAYLEDGAVWVLNHDLNKKYKLIDTTSTIASFDLSPDKNEVYWTTNAGELWKRGVDGKIQPLVTVANDMTEVEDIQGGEWDASGTFPGGVKFTYFKGRVRNFYISPSGKYIVYEAVEHYTSCCMGHNDFPTYSLWSMKSDGTQKTKMLGPGPGFVKFKGWLPKDAGIMYLTHFTDEPTTGQGFYKISFDGKNNYEGTNYIIIQATPYVYQFPGTAPVFSPDGKKVAFYNYMDGVSLWDAADGSHEQKLVATDGDSGDPFFFDINWSSDSQSLAVRTGSTTTVFNNSGEAIFTAILPVEPRDFPIFSKDNKYVTHIFGKDGKTILVLVNLTRKEIREFDISDTVTVYNRFPTAYPKLILNDSTLYFISTQEHMSGEPDPTQALWVLDITTGGKRKISNNVSSVFGF